MPWIGPVLKVVENAAKSMHTKVKDKRVAFERSTFYKLANRMNTTLSNVSVYNTKLMDVLDKTKDSFIRHVENPVMVVDSYADSLCPGVWGPLACTTTVSAVSNTHANTLQPSLLLSQLQRVSSCCGVVLTG